MARVCDFTGKRTVSGRNRSHSMRQTNRQFKPNLISKIIDIGDGQKIRVKIAASFYKKYKSEL